MTSPIIALMTDFGTREPFVGTMKAVILSRCPEARIVDLTHEIPPQAIDEGAFWLERSARYFPGRTIFVAVVDPGVGSSRRGLVARVGGRVFVAPDNGLIGGVVERADEVEVYEIDGARVGLPDPSATFHGRDVFAPIAADIAAGRLAVSDVGARLGTWCSSPLARARLSSDEIEGRVVTTDRFGNLITNIESSMLAGTSDVVVRIGRVHLDLVRTYADIRDGACAALVNSFGVLEIALRDASAAAALGSQKGDPVVVRWRSAGASLKITP